MANIVTPPQHILELSSSGSVITVGNFDGVHLGHRSLIDATLEDAARLGVPAIALTFEPHPRSFFAGHQPETFRLSTAAQRERLLLEAGLDAVWTCEFGAPLAQLTATEFAKGLLADTLSTRSLRVGADFKFAKNRSGDVSWLQANAATLGFETISHPTFTLNGEAVSSSRLRKAVASGDLETIQALSGRIWSYSGVTASGAGRGKGMGIPTLNLTPSHQLLPPYGVFATAAKLGDGPWRESITNIGVRPTFEDEVAPTIETLILDGKDVPPGAGHELEVRLLTRIRAEQSFDSPEALKAQIASDLKVAAEAHAAIDWLG